RVGSILFSWAFLFGSLLRGRSFFLGSCFLWCSFFRNRSFFLFCHTFSNRTIVFRAFFRYRTCFLRRCFSILGGCNCFRFPFLDGIKAGSFLGCFSVQCFLPCIGLLLGKSVNFSANCCFFSGFPFLKPFVCFFLGNRPFKHAYLKVLSYQHTTVGKHGF